ncbi:hypothetical protein L873DRAFT_1728891 [Choiromyces venosus 120613-1]|uniref:Uncharacterized protein n=1 Tax=Choiromyces venosus 120613-1 TaxID=1336337 RepID=A0A3N4K329_9PEZI|nr:hypothetical protein L873DRAFT_1728891 [Choiromyces venosus 120613-1]
MTFCPIMRSTIRFRTSFGQSRIRLVRTRSSYWRRGWRIALLDMVVTCPREGENNLRTIGDDVVGLKTKFAISERWKGGLREDMGQSRGRVEENHRETQQGVPRGSEGVEGCGFSIGTAFLVAYIPRLCCKSPAIARLLRQLWNIGEDLGGGGLVIGVWFR